MPPRLWQRQPGEAPADFTAFVAYLRLKGRRSHRAAAAQTGRSLGAIRRLSARLNWPARVAAFEARLADASQNALDLLPQACAARTQADCERFRMALFQLAQRVLAQSGRWLRLASDPRRRDVSLSQVCRVTELASKLGRLAAGMPTGDEPRRRPRREDNPGYWTGPSVEEALAKIYGSDSSPSPVPSPEGAAGDPQPAAPASGGPGAPTDASVAPHPAVSGPPVVVHARPVPSSSEPATGQQPPPSAGEASVGAPRSGRRDAWATWARAQRRAAGIKA